MARCMAMAGVRPGMVVHNAYGYGLFTGGLGFHQGAERLGATVVPVSGGLTARQAMLLRDLQGAGAVLHAVLRAAHRRRRCARPGSAPDELSLEVGLFGAEPWTEAMREQLERELGLTRAQLLRAVGDRRPGRGGRVPEAADGLHVNEDHFLVEVSTRTGEPSPAEGELVFTTLTKEALPLLRYRTGDIASLTERAVRVRADARAHERRARAAATTC